MILKVFLEVQSLESEKPPLYLSWGGPVLDFFFSAPQKKQLMWSQNSPFVISPNPKNPGMS